MDQVVSLPDPGNSKTDTIQLLASIGHFACPGRWPPFQLERDLEARFAASQTISFADTIAWLTESNIVMTRLSDASTWSDLEADAEALHKAMQTQNDAQSLQLLSIINASKLIEVQDTGEAGLSSQQFISTAVGCLLLRYGYSTDQSYAYYHASLPGDSRRPVRLTWASLIDAGISAVVAIAPPVKPLDVDGINSSMHIMAQALNTAAQAHANVLALLAQSTPGGQGGAV